MNLESFTYSTEEYGMQLTENSHQTLYWLNRNGYLDNETTLDLLSRMVVVPIRNNKTFGQRLLNRFFNKESPGNTYAFPITLLEDACNPKDKDSDKPHLKLVK